MNIETMIYIYIAICISLIVYNCVYLFILRRREKNLTWDSENFKDRISEQLQKITNNQSVDDAHVEFLNKSLKKVKYLTAFDKSLDEAYKDAPEITEKYIAQIYPVFAHLTKEYLSKDDITATYFPYIVGKYNILKYADTDEIINIMFELLYSENVYCRENALKAIYGTGNSDYVAEALKVIDNDRNFHHSKLVCDGLMSFAGEKSELASKLLEKFERYSVNMQLNILNYIRFAGVRCDEMFLSVLHDEKRDNELRFSAIRYFEKFPHEEAKDILQSFARNEDKLPWQYQAIASSAIKSYPDKLTFEILKDNLSSANWYVRLNSAVSCEKMGYTYTELINIFDGNDRYAREILRYCLDRRKAKEKAVAK